MPGFYTDTRTMVKTYPPTRVVASTLKTALDALDDSLYATSLLSAGAGATGFRNLVRNGSFEVWERGIAAAPDNWAVTGTGATLAREATIIKHKLYSAKLTRVGNDCHLSQNVYPLAGSAYLKSRVVALGAWVYATIASRARLRINDGTTTTYSSYHTGGSGWEFLTVSVTTGAGTSALNVGLQIDSGNTSAYVDGVMLVEGNTVSQYAPVTPPFNQLPRRATLWHQDAREVVGSALTAAVLNTQQYNVLVSQSPATRGDTFRQSFLLQAGTYTLSVLGQTSAAKGIVQWSIDNVAVAMTQDWYSAGTVQNVIKTLTVTVVGDGYHQLTGSVINKNAASSGYAMGLTKYWLKAASD